MASLTERFLIDPSVRIKEVLVEIRVQKREISRCEVLYAIGSKNWNLETCFRLFAFLSKYDAKIFFEAFFQITKRFVELHFQYFRR